MWNKKDIDFLKKNYATVSCREIGKQLNKTYWSVRYEAEKAGLTIKNKIRKNPNPYKNGTRGNWLYKKYSLTIEEYDAMWNKQNGVCAICGQPETAMNTFSGKKVLLHLSVDHDHKTGKIRGLLCDRCNTSIGKFEENTDFLMNAIIYLNSHLSQGGGNTKET